MTWRGIVDTGPIVALLDQRDAWHAWARAAFDELDAPLATCDAVLSEACFLLRRARLPPELVLRLLEQGAIAPAWSVGDDVHSVRTILSRYADVPASFADACLVRMAELSPGSPVVTLDRDFGVYRLRGRRRPRLVAPFAP